MIPRHRPPFSVGSVILQMLSPKRFSVEQVEDAFAHETGMPHALLLPSARAGIYLALRVASERGSPVVCPANTCNAVHEAVVRSGASIHLVDSGNAGFLMDESALSAAQNRSRASVLCEIYGYTYDLPAMTAKAPTSRSLRIVDMAMSVPSPRLFERLGDNDLAVLSFGIGKSMYAGWGGMALARNASLAAEVRRLRDSLVGPGNLRLVLRRNLETLSRTLAHERLVYGFLRKIRQSMRDDPQPSGLQPSWNGEQNLSGEWSLPSTFLDRALALRNLDLADHYRERRVALAQRYHDNFGAAAGVVRPAISPHALSHFTIRVGSSIRGAVREALWRSGIDAGTLFDFPYYLSRTDYPNTSSLASEVLNLPLDPSLEIDEVDRISECVMRSVADCRRSGRFTEQPEKSAASS